MEERTHISFRWKNENCQGNTRLFDVVIGGETDNMDNTSNNKRNDTKNSGIDLIMDLERYGTYQKLLFVRSYVLRFVQNCRKERSQRTNGYLKSTEIQKAKILWIKQCQEIAFNRELQALRDNSLNQRKLPRISQLRLFMDENGLLRCRGRVHNAPIPENAKFPY